MCFTFCLLVYLYLFCKRRFVQKYCCCVSDVGPGSSSSTTDQQQQRQTNAPKVGRLNETTQILPTDNFKEGDVRELESLGFTREQAISELRRFNGDKTQAMAALFAKSLQF